MVPAECYSLVTDCFVGEDEILNTSDHRPVHARLNLCSVRSNVVNRVRKGVKRWDKLGVTERQSKYEVPLEKSLRSVISTLSAEDITPIALDNCIDAVVAKMELAARVVPTVKFKKHLKPYWNDHMNFLKAVKISKYKAWIREGRPRGNGYLTYLEYKESKKAFNKELGRLDKLYENEQVIHAVKAAEVDRGQFWRLVKRNRKKPGNKTTAIKDKSGKAISDVDGILNIWKDHFQNLSTPKSRDDYDQEHAVSVSKEVEGWNNENDEGMFLNTNFTLEEVRKAIGKLHKRKACGFDGITTEHLVYGGEAVVVALTLIYNHILRLEYVPVNLRRGIQIPLFKGKGLCCLETDSYRGISLLTNFNKVYEVLIWERIKDWWVNDKVISDLQGASKKKQSCVHSAWMLQETVSYALEKHDRVFVSFLDVSKAYDSVWTDGLFFQLHEMGIRGKLWRLMYRAYCDFRCRVRIEDKTSDWYTMGCGIHQGGFLSVTKYVAFINSLLRELEASQLCCSILKVPSTPVGYADDLATASTSKTKADRALQVVHNFGKRWRFEFNARKSAVLVYGEDRKEHEKASKERVFLLGREKVSEKTEYDHVGIKACIFAKDNTRISEKISKGRRALNATTGIGIRKNGLTLKVCNLIFWTIVVPTLTFGCELWTFGDDDCDRLQAFQRYASRRLQRFPLRSPSCSSYFGLGWLRLDTLVQVKKLLFLLTFLGLGEDNVIRVVFMLRLRQYVDNVGLGMSNQNHSPLFDMLNVCARFGLFKEFLNMALGGSKVMGKKTWSSMVWKKAWALDDAFRQSTCTVFMNNDILFNTVGNSQYLNWWWLADNLPSYQGLCEIMAKLVCHASRLKCDDIRFRGTSGSNLMCEACNGCATESAVHLVMQCPAFEEDRKKMFERIFAIDPECEINFIENPGQTFFRLMGKNIEGFEMNRMAKIWITAGQCITKIYKQVLKAREGVG